MLESSISQVQRISERIKQVTDASYPIRVTDEIKGDRLTGIADSERHYVKITQTLVRKLDDDELAWVIAHEFAHLELRHSEKEGKE